MCCRTLVLEHLSFEEELVGVGGEVAGPGAWRQVGRWHVADVVLGDVQRGRHADGADHVRLAAWKA